ncbi:MAG: AmmeMemoRadiSam system protein B [Endomicrobiia bacterium]
MSKFKFFHFIELKYVVFILFFCMIEPSFSLEEIRKPAVSGQFYPSDAKELKNTIKRYFENIKNLPLAEGEILGIISPHAGYIFSGQVAAYSYKYLSQYKIENPIVILIGQSHYYHLKKPALYPKGKFLTSLGEVKIEENFVEELLKEKEYFEIFKEAHIPEHSLEVQLPFLQYIYSEFSIVPILVSSYDYNFTTKISEKLVDVIKNYKTQRKIIIVCSTDMSHYPKYEDAVDIDNKAIEVLKLYDGKKYFEEIPKLAKEKVQNLYCVFCAETAVGISLISSKLLGGDKVVILKYNNSGDVEFYKEKSRVVGYLSSAFIKTKTTQKEKTENMKEEEFKISEENQKILLSLARQAIKEYINSGKVIDYKTKDPELLEKSAVFVTLTKKGQLRGCIGTTFPQEPLYKAVINMAIAAATEDPRFSPLSLDELKDIKIEISILSPLKRVFSHKDIKEKIHGVVIRSGFRSGLFLPQVWEQLPKKEQFLSELCWSKAGLPPNAWQDPKTELYVFGVFAFEEE